jgi:regulatory protein
MERNETQRAFQTGLRILGYRPRTRKEVVDRLERRFSSDAAQQAVERLEQSGYLDDADFARSWRRSREADRPRSASLIRRELEQRGVSREVAEEAVADLDEDDSAYRAGLRRLSSLRDLDWSTFRRRLGDYLRRRGFPITLTYRIVERLWTERYGC